MQLTTIQPDRYLMKWQFTSMCLLLSWKNGLEAMERAPWLLLMNFIGETLLNFNFSISWLIHISSHLTNVIVQYLTLDLAKTSRFLLSKRCELAAKNDRDMCPFFFLCNWIIWWLLGCPTELINFFFLFLTMNWLIS
jgi:hypothetical protein